VSFGIVRYLIKKLLPLFIWVKIVPGCNDKIENLIQGENN